MKRSWFMTLGLGAAVSAMALVPGFRVAAGDACDLVTVGLDIFPVAFQAHQPSSLGDFKGHVGVALPRLPRVDRRGSMVASSAHALRGRAGCARHCRLLGGGVELLRRGGTANGSRGPEPAEDHASLGVPGRRLARDSGFPVADPG